MIYGSNYLWAVSTDSDTVFIDLNIRSVGSPIRSLNEPIRYRGVNLISSNEAVTNISVINNEAFIDFPVGYEMITTIRINAQINFEVDAENRRIRFIAPRLGFYRIDIYGLDASGGGVHGSIPVVFGT